MGKRIGIMGGTFDPPHFGHLVPVNAVRKEFNLDWVWFVPAYIPPHKFHNDMTGPFHRVAMLALALQPYPEFLLSPVELERGEISYTIDTIREIKQKLSPEDRLHFIMGSDSFLELHTWRSYDLLLQECDLIIINRGAGELELKTNLEQLENTLRLDLTATVHFASAPFLPISSTEIRFALRDGRSISGLVPVEVEGYIKKQSLFR